MTSGGERRRECTENHQLKKFRCTKSVRKPELWVDRCSFLQTDHKKRDSSGIFLCPEHVAPLLYKKKEGKMGARKKPVVFLQTCPLRFSIPAWSSNPWFLGRKCWKKLSNTCDGTPSSVLVNFVLKVCRCIIVVHTRRRDMQGNSSSSQNRYMRWDIGRHACTV